MSFLIPIVMFGWIPLELWLFKRLRKHHAVIAGFVIAWLFLPQCDYEIPSLPNYSKISASTYVVLLAVLLFDRERLLAFRPHVLDIPLAVYCVSAFFSSVTNGLGVWDGLSATVGAVTTWFMPYLIGRLYFGGLSSLKDLAIGLFVGGLIYVPFCLFELRVSPQLHRLVYGFHPHEFSQTRRWGGWRPVVFMKHGLMVGMWMSAATLAALQLNRARMLEWTRSVFGIPPRGLVGGLLVTTVLCKSSGAIALLVIGWGALWVCTRFRTRLPFLLLISIPTLYMTLRATGQWDVQNAIRFMNRRLPARRAGSFSYRIENENILLEKALRRRWFGWGGWQRPFVFNERGAPVSVPDGLWILTLGKNGLLGLVSMTLALMLPPLLFLGRFPPPSWRRPEVAIGMMLCMLVCLFSIDSLLNDMFNPIILLIMGGVTSLLVHPPVAGEELPSVGTVSEPGQCPYRPRLI